MSATSVVHRSARPAQRSAAAAAAAGWLTDQVFPGRPRSRDMHKLASRLDPVLSAEVTAPGVAGGAALEVMLTAALGRALARTVGTGTLSVHVDGELAEGSIGRLDCTLEPPLTTAALLSAYAPSVLADGAQSPEAWVSYRSVVAGTSAPEGYLLALHARRGADVIYLDWWYDSRSFERHTVEEFDEQLPLALIEVTSN